MRRRPPSRRSCRWPTALYWPPPAPMRLRCGRRTQISKVWLTVGTWRSVEYSPQLYLGHQRLQLTFCVQAMRFAKRGLNATIATKEHYGRYGHRSPKSGAVRAGRRRLLAAETFSILTHRRGTLGVESGHG